jgi:hypothetical protein
MTALAAQAPKVTGVALTTHAPTASTGDTVPVGSKVLVDNRSGSSINVTVVNPGNDTYGNAKPDIVTAVAAGAEAQFGPFGQGLADPETGVVTLICSAVSTVTLKVLAR